jgi:hypothetical protein
MYISLLVFVFLFILFLLTVYGKLMLGPHDCLKNYEENRLVLDDVHLTTI